MYINIKKKKKFTVASPNSYIPIPLLFVLEELFNYTEFWKRKKKKKGKRSKERRRRRGKRKHFKMEHDFAISYNFVLNM